MSEEKMVCSRFPVEVIEIIDGMVDMGFFRSRSEFLRYAVHRATSEYLMGLERAYRILGGDFLKVTYWIKDGESVRKAERKEMLNIVNKTVGLGGVKVVEELELIEGVDRIVFDVGTGQFEISMSGQEG